MRVVTEALEILNRLYDYAPEDRVSIPGVMP